MSLTFCVLYAHGLSFEANENLPHFLTVTRAHDLGRVRERLIALERSFLITTEPAAFEIACHLSRPVLFLAKDGAVPPLDQFIGEQNRAVVLTEHLASLSADDIREHVNQLLYRSAYNG